MRMTRTVTVLAAVLIAASTACSNGGVELGGNLVFGEQQPDAQPGDVVEEPIEKQCPNTVDGETLYTVNNNVVSNVGDEPVTITRVSLDDARNMTLVDASLFRLPKETDPYMMPANGYGFPPYADTEHAAGRKAWKDRLQAEGTVVEPGDSWTLGIVVKFDDPRASLKRIRVEFRDPDGDRHEIPGTVSVRLDPGC